MTERPNQHERLLAETFHDDWTDGPSANFARVAATHARGRKRRRRTLVGAATLVLIFALVVLPRFSPRDPTPADASLTAAADTPRGYELISDKELREQMSAHPVLSIQNEDGTQDIVLLGSENSPAVSP